MSRSHAAGPIRWRGPVRPGPQWRQARSGRCVHDGRVRRIAAITPDMVCPKPHDFAPGASAHDPPKAERFGDRIMRPLIFRARSDAKPVPNFADRALFANRVTISPTGLG